AEHDAARARQLALDGVLPLGGTAVWENDPDFQARKLMADRCLGCHIYQGAGENRAPLLDGWSTRAWLSALLRDPDGARFYGKTDVHAMKPVAAPDDELAALTEFVYAEGGGG